MMGLSSPFFDKNVANAKDALSKMKWEDVDALSELIIDYMIDFGADIGIN